jgi:hypothetical protein
VTPVSKFHLILSLVAQESKLGRKSLILRKNYEQFWVDQTSPVLLPDKSDTVQGGLVQLKGRQVYADIFSSTFDDYFEHNLLTISLIDHIFLPLAS